MLHRVIQRCGLEDCGELVALATPDQLAAVFDLDLWRAGRPGLDEQFDADRFGLWLEVLMESGASVAAQTLAGDGRRSGDRGASPSTCASSIRAAVSPRRRRRGVPTIPADDLGRVGGYRSWPAHRLVGRDRRRAARPRRGASRLLPSGDARMPAPVELRLRARWIGRPARRQRAGHVRPGGRS